MAFKCSGAASVGLSYGTATSVVDMDYEDISALLEFGSSHRVPYCAATDGVNDGLNICWVSDGISKEIGGLQCLVGYGIGHRMAHNIAQIHVRMRAHANFGQAMETTPDERNEHHGNSNGNENFSAKIRYYDCCVHLCGKHSMRI